MKKLLATSALLGVMIPSIALADTKNFEGLSAGLNLNLISAGVKLSYDGYTVDGLGGKETQSASLDVGYGIKMGTTGVFTVGLDVDLSKPKIFAISDEDGEASAKQKNRYGIYFAPGIAINKDTLLYGKIGYNKMKGEITGDGETSSENFSGVSYGIGAKVMMSKSMFVKVEAGRQTFSSKTVDDVSYKPSATVGTIGIGMQF